MSLRERFPEPDGIPEERRWTPTDAGLRLIVEGRLSSWEGPSAPIASPVRLRGAGGRLEPLELGRAALANADTGRTAVESARRAWEGGRGEWARASVETRIGAVEDFVRRARPLREDVARALMWEVGKPWKDSLKEFDRTLEYVEDTIDCLRDIERTAAAPLSTGGVAARVRRAPLGVSLCMGPYNYAINEAFTLIVPALIMGNPVVIKTPRFGIVANALLAPALAEAFPPGVVSFVSGDGATVVGPMMESGIVDVLALIGSHRTAGILLRQHPHPYRLRSVLGMGAKNTAIVLADADLDDAADEIVSGALTFSGQRCTALKLILGQRGIVDRLVERLAERIDALSVGMPWDDGVVVTPLPDPERPAYLAELVDEAVATGARVVNRGGGERAETLFRPALLYPVAREARLFRVEQFGPVVPVAAFDEPAEALGVIAEASVGQQASIFGHDPVVIGKLVDHLANLVCRVNLNTQCRRGPDVLPFTGRKDSAAGTLSVSDALRVFSIRSLVATPAADADRLEALSDHSSFLARPGEGR